MKGYKEREKKKGWNIDKCYQRPNRFQNKTNWKEKEAKKKRRKKGEKEEKKEKKIDFKIKKIKIKIKNKLKVIGKRGVISVFFLQLGHGLSLLGRPCDIKNNISSWTTLALHKKSTGYY